MTQTMVYMVHVYAVSQGWGDNMAFITTVVNSFGGAWFDADMKPALDSAAWNEAINFYVDLLGNYGPPGSEG